MLIISYIQDYMNMFIKCLTTLAFLPQYLNMFNSGLLS
jgi:hypothetical protein